MIALAGVRIARGRRILIDGLDATPPAGSLVLIAGPNGAGKSTLLDALAGDAAPAAGRILLGGTPIHRLPLAVRAQRRAFLPQRTGIAFGFAVADVVAMGLAPFAIDPGRARAIVDAAMADADVAHFAGRPATALSGGEQQRVHIARTLAQVEAALASGIAHPLLLLDEPLTGLDYAHQFALMRRFGRAAAAGVQLWLSLHDLALGAAWASHMLLIAAGQPPRFAAPAVLLQPDVIAATFALSPCETARVLAASRADSSGVTSVPDPAMAAA